MPLWRGHIVSGRAAAASMRVAWLGCVGLPPGSEAKGRRARPSGRNTRRDADIYSYQHPPWVHLHLAYHEGEGSRAGGTYATLDLPGGTTRPWRSAPETQNAPVRAPPACRTTDSAPRPKSTHGANWHEDSAPTTPGAPPSTGTNASPPERLASHGVYMCVWAAPRAPSTGTTAHGANSVSRACLSTGTSAFARASPSFPSPGAASPCRHRGRPPSPASWQPSRRPPQVHAAGQLAPSLGRARPGPARFTGSPYHQVPHVCQLARRSSRSSLPGVAPGAARFAPSSPPALPRSLMGVSITNRAKVGLTLSDS